MKPLFGNAELQRNLWLEMTLQRLIVGPLVIALIVFVLFATSHNPLGTLASLGSYGFIGATVLWGARLAAQSLNEEFVEGTWDGQRTSSLSAWSMCVGKLFGGAAFAWYLGACFLLVFLVGAIPTMAPISLLESIVGLLLLAVFTQSLSLLMTLIGWRRLRRIADSRHRGLSLLIVLMLLPTIGKLLPWLDQHAAANHLLIWFDRPWPATEFMLVSLALFSGWALLGLHRAMRAELQFNDRPWTWIAFVLFLQVYVAGWIGHAAFDRALQAASGLSLLGSLPALRLAAAALVALLLAYLFIFAEAKDRLRYQRLITALHAGQPGRLLDSPPLWLVNALMAVITAIAIVAAAGTEGGDRLALVAGLLAVLCYVLRDFAIVLYCNFGPSRRRADAAAVFYLAVLYLLPMALLVAADLDSLAGLVQPISAFGNPLWLIAALAWAAGSLDLLKRRWHRGSPSNPS